MRNKKIILKTFFTFLKENNALNEYCIALKNGGSYRYRNGYAQIKPCSGENDFIVEYVKEKPDLLIMDAFRWLNSNESLWNNLHNKWCKVCKSRNFI